MSDPIIHSITAPSSVSLPNVTIVRVGVPGIIINDAWAAGHAGTMVVNVSCLHGMLRMVDNSKTPLPGCDTAAMQVTGALIVINAALATLEYATKLPAVADIITIDVWNMAGVQYGKTIQVNLASTPTPTSIPAPTIIPTPTPAGTIISDPTGIVARRVADVLHYGVNTFANGQDGAGVNASADAHIIGLRYILGDSGINMLAREYGSYAAQATFCAQITQALPNVGWSICLTTLSSINPVLQMMQSSASGSKWLKFVEGINEANNTAAFGFAPTSPADCLRAQQQLYNAAKPLGIGVLAPALADTTGSPTFLQDYFAATLPGIIAACDYYNSHDYPNSGAPNKELYNRTKGISAVLANKPGFITEFHPTLYNSVTKDETTAAVYTLNALLSAAWDFDCRGIIHFCMYDYKNAFDTAVGLFKAADPTAPHPVATALKALFALTGDTAANKFSFTPGRLDVSISGLPSGFNKYSGGRYAVLQRASGVFYLVLWNEQDKLNLTTRSLVAVKFNAGAKSRVVDYSVTDPIIATPRVRQSLVNVSQLTLDLTTEVRVLQIYQ